MPDNEQPSVNPAVQAPQAPPAAQEIAPRGKDFKPPAEPSTQNGFGDIHVADGKIYLNGVNDAPQAPPAEPSTQNQAPSVPVTTPTPVVQAVPQPAAAPQPPAAVPVAPAPSVAPTTVDALVLEETTL